MSKIPSYLLVVDTQGLAVTVSLAAEKLTASLIKKFLEENEAAKKVRHRQLIIPGDAARLKHDIEEKSGWKVVVGPVDSSHFEDFLKKQKTIDG